LCGYLVSYWGCGRGFKKNIHKKKNCPSSELTTPFLVGKIKFQRRKHEECIGSCCRALHTAVVVDGGL
jgi:hypothetical protein